LVKDGIKPIPYAEGVDGLAFTSRRRHVLHADIHKLKYANTDGVLRQGGERQRELAALGTFQ
jgi:hypothetical protein